MRLISTTCTPRRGGAGPHGPDLRDAVRRPRYVARRAANAAAPRLQCHVPALARRRRQASKRIRCFARQLDRCEPILRRPVEEWPQIKAPQATGVLRDYGLAGSVDVVRRPLRELRQPMLRPAQRTGLPAGAGYAARLGGDADTAEGRRGARPTSSRVHYPPACVSSARRLKNSNPALPSRRLSPVSRRCSVSDRERLLVAELSRLA